MRRAILALLCLFGLGLAGAFAATVLAGTGPLALLGTTGSTGTSTGSTTTTTTSTTTTTTSTTTTTTTTTAAIADGVTIGGYAVGGMTAADATVAVRKAFAAPLQLLVAHRRLARAPAQLGARAAVTQAVARAQSAAAGTRVPLLIHVDGRTLRRYVALVAKRFDSKPIDATLVLDGVRPVVTPDHTGGVLERGRAVASIVTALLAGRRGPIRLVQKLVPAKQRANAFGAVIVIRRSSNRLYLYSGMKLWRIFGVATGQSAYPTPLGRFQIVVKWRNPWWYPPASPWARGEKPTPPGPGNPLGTRWMGLSAPGVGIHGTPNDASIGYSASHGCIRMHIPDAEWLFTRVQIGTPVFIVAA